METVKIVFWSQGGNTAAMAAAGAAVVGGEGVICQETPDDGAIASCRALGRTLAAL